MKTPLMIVTGFWLTMNAATAQTNTSRYDHTYSTHNYKHANKAAEARQWERQAGMPVTAPAGPVTAANYKQPQPGITPVGSLSVVTNGPAAVASRNYKAGYRPVVLPEQTRYANRTDAKQPTGKTVSGEE